MITVIERKTINPALHIIECPSCNKVLASASDLSFLPLFSTCSCEDFNTKNTKTNSVIVRSIAHIKFHIEKEYPELKGKDFRGYKDFVHSSRWYYHNSINFGTKRINEFYFYVQALSKNYKVTILESSLDLGNPMCPSYKGYVITKIK